MKHQYVQVDGLVVASIIVAAAILIGFSAIATKMQLIDEVHHPELWEKYYEKQNEASSE